MDKLKYEIRKRKLPDAVLKSWYIEFRMSYKTIASRLRKEGIECANERNVREYLQNELGVPPNPKKFVKEGSLTYTLKILRDENMELKEALEFIKNRYEKEIEEKKREIEYLRSLNKEMFDLIIKAYIKQKIDKSEFHNITENYKKT